MKFIADRVAIVLLAISTCSVGLASASARPSASLRGGAAAAATNANSPAADSLEQQPPPQPRRLDTTVVFCMQNNGEQWLLLPSCNGLQCSSPGVPCGDGTADPDCHEAMSLACGSTDLAELSLTTTSDGSPGTSWYACCNYS
jgi:hypothetical protein